MVVSRRQLLHATVIAAGLLLIAAAATADALRGMGVWAVVLDTAVGGIFLVAGAVCIAGPLSRTLCAAVGALWLIGSIVPLLATSHRAALAICLLVFPASRIPGVLSWTLVVCALPAGMGGIPQAAVAVIFALIAIARMILVRTAGAPTGGRGATVGAGLGAALIALVFAVGATGALGASAAAVLLAYQLALIGVAIVLIASTRLRPSRRHDLPDALLSTGPSGIAGLEQLLRALLHDPSVRIHLVHAPQAEADADDPGSSGVSESVPEARAEQRTVAVLEAGVPIAHITHRSESIPDERTLRSVLEATRLTAIHERGTAALEDQQRQIRAARRRLRDAGDRRRRELAARIQDDVLAPIAQARVAVDAAESLVRSDEGRASLALVATELAGTEQDLRAIALGTASHLGSGQLHDQLRALAARHPAVIADMDADAAGDSAAEDALLYVASELVANALKHASAEHITVRLRRVGNELELGVTDDGSGGADPEGSGIEGLRRRLAPLHGRLRISSVQGSGTAATAVIPVSPPSSRASR